MSDPATIDVSLPIGEPSYELLVWSHKYEEYQPRDPAFIRATPDECVRHARDEYDLSFEFYEIKEVWPTPVVYGPHETTMGCFERLRREIAAGTVRA